MTLLESSTKIFLKSTDKFCFIALTKSVTQYIRGATERHCLSKWIFSQQQSDTKLLQSIYFVYEVGSIRSYSNRICYRKTAESCAKDAFELHAALRTVFEDHHSTSKTTLASYDVTALATSRLRWHSVSDVTALLNHCCSLVS